MIGNLFEVLNYNQLILTLNPFIYNYCSGWFFPVHWVNIYQVQLKAYYIKLLYFMSPILIVLLNTNCKSWCSVTNTEC